MLTWVTLGRVLPKVRGVGDWLRKGQPADQPAIHTLDLMQWFAGRRDACEGVVDSVVATTEGEDSAMATLHFANGARPVLRQQLQYHRFPF